MRAQDKYDAEQKSKSADAAMLKEQVGTLSEQISATEKSMKEATETRLAEKKENEQSIQDAKDAQNAVSRAMETLSNFYANAAGATAFVQVNKGVPMGSPEWDQLDSPTKVYGSSGAGDTGHKEGEQTFGDKYTGAQDASATILGILEVVLSDYAHDEVETKTAESTAEAAYEELMNDSKVSLAKKRTEKDLKTRDAEQSEADAANAASNLKNTNKQLDAANKEHDALKPMCPAEFGGTKDVVTFEEKQAKVKEEIESLKMAMDMLSS